ncbi:glycogen/starch synthase [Prevotella histicola]|uniref:glycogen/starch synthase n=1 Tax=Prevotella histicola TaxID=470565 RepID=UPI001C5D53C1|nr:glycogen/starch synthase [Prevotella histicola]MBW4775547.1 glycogen/starch synthase [Prevotella histicola]
MGKKVLFVNQEIIPYVPETEMSLFGSEMPTKMQEAGFEIRTFMPRWGNINERRGQLHEVIRLSGMNLIIDDTDHPLIIKVASIPQTRIQVYFIDNEDYFQKRPAMTKDELGNDYPDNGERAIFFARGVLETVKKLRWAPDIIHCQGWMTSVIPFYVKTAYKNEPQFANSKVITSLFTEQPQSNLGENFKQCLEFREIKAGSLKKYGDNFDFMELGKLAIDYSDGVISTSNNVNLDLIDYAKTSKASFFEHSVDDADLKEKYSEFYNNII